MEAIVETTHGRVRGRRSGGVLVFRGIPYAASPAGAARWRPPAPPRPWAGVRAALEPAPCAPQPAGIVGQLFGDAAQRADEDCLALDVWTPAADAGRRPVMVWIHGGAFTTGAGSLPVYDGATLAQRGDVVVVTLNYRLGALGFLFLPGLAREEGGAPGNYGLLDQIAALEWVRANAEAFGGDPSRVTLFGQSAGAMCAADLLAAPRARGLVQRAILQSGAARNVHPPEVALRVAAVFCDEAGVGPGDVSALRRLPLEAVLAAQARSTVRLARELTDPPFEPVVDGALLPEAPAAALAAGAAADVPLLIGTNRDEWKYYGLADPKAHGLDDAGLLRRFRRGLPGVDARGCPWAERVIEVYREARAGAASVHPRELWFAIQTDRWFRHPAATLAAAHAERQARTWAYLFTWESPALSGALGSCHALELPFVFGGVDDPRLRGVLGEGPERGALSRRMQDAWLAFARGDAPGAPGLPAWPAYERGRRATLVLGAECGCVEAPGERERAFWDEVS